MNTSTVVFSCGVSEVIVGDESDLGLWRVVQVVWNGVPNQLIIAVDDHEYGGNESWSTTEKCNENTYQAKRCSKGRLALNYDRYNRP